MLDVALHLQSQGLVPINARSGNVYFETEDGTQTGTFNLSDWASEQGYTIERIDGLNTPITALDSPPEGFNELDQAVFFMDGMNIDALRGIFPETKHLDDGRIVVKDKDGLWKCMWTDNWSPPDRVPEYEELVESGLALDLKKGMRKSGLALLFGLAGVEPKGDTPTPKEVGKMLTTLKANLPIECRIMLARLVEQTIGIDKWKFQAALINPSDVNEWLTATKKESSFEIRRRESNLTEHIVKGMHELATSEFLKYMGMLEKSDMTKAFICNLKEPLGEFIQVMMQMDVISDISKITGLDEWKQMARGEVDEAKLPPMPDFVPKLTKLLQWVMPISQKKELMLARGKQGFKSVVSIMAMVDDVLFSIRDVPESSAKQKMFMCLKTLQSKLESKMSYYYHPVDDKTGLKVNEFMAYKAMYTEKREIVYKLIQLPKEVWVSDMLQTLQQVPNLEAFYGTLPKEMSGLLQSFVALEIAYDMQPWIDDNYEKRTNDPFAMFTEEYGSPPPEAGYLAKNSPRAALNIIDTLAAMSGMLMSMEDVARRQLLRSPMLMAKMLKNMQTASVQREVGAVEAVARSGVIHMDDPYSSPDPTRIWEDPSVVEKDVQEQMMEQLRQMQAEEDAKQQALVAEGAASQLAMQGAGPEAPGDTAPPVAV
ncbi:hypothetical protein [Caudoviricetes sp.]|nr:hypothetical protein [Caudoviricetes sp.]UOF79139.1 hypothetical protein [Caudoviricetes sp.]